MPSTQHSALNKQQKEAVGYIDGPCLVLAGAGSGKTSVITQKIAYLISECNYQARHIAALTFTNKAAKEMKSRVSGLLKKGLSRGLTVATFHNLGLTIFKEHCQDYGYRPGFSIFDAEDVRSLLKELLMKDNIDVDNDQINQYLSYISQCKNDLLDPEQALSKAKDDKEQFCALVYRHYSEALKIYNAVDFDDLILLPVTWLSQKPAILEKWKTKIRYLLVDEYQDTNTSQYRLIQLLMQDRGALTVVGDDDQSIYTWRGARPENLKILQQDFANLHVIKLEQNYRSTQRILKVANHLIDHNPHEFTKSLWSDRGMGELIRIIRCQNEEAEAERTATEIITQRLQRKARFRDFAVLYRSNHQARLVEMKLQHYQVPYNLSGGTAFFSRTEIKDIMAYLRVLVNPDDDNALLRIINTPRRQLGTSTIEKLSDYASSRQISLLSAAQEMGLEHQLTPAVWKRLQQFAQWITQLSLRCEEDNPIPALNEMIEDMDYLGWLHQQTSTPKAAEKRMENIQFLFSSIQQTLEQGNSETLTETPSFTLKDALSKLLLMDLLEQQEQEDDSDRVQLMTLHAAKGLEFPYVFLIGFEENLLPHRTSIDEDNIEEERRLTYVGITRAQKALTILFPASRKQFGEVIDVTPSRFMEEMPQEDLVKEGVEENTQQEKIQGEDALDNILSMFDDNL